MILAQNGLRRNRNTPRRLAIGIAFILSSAVAVLCSDWDLEGAKLAWAEATRLHEALSSASKPSRENYLKCIRTYQQVYFKDPHYSASDDAVFEAARLYQEMGEKFGDLNYFRDAAKLYRFLTTDYEVSPFCPDALLRLGMISEGLLGDDQAAQSAYEKLRKYYKYSPAAASLAARARSKEVKPPQLSIPAPAVTTTLPARPTAAPSATTTPAAKQTAAPVKSPDGPTAVMNISFSSNKDYTRVSIVSGGELHYNWSQLSNPERVYFDITNARLDSSLTNRTFTISDKFVKQVRVAQNRVDVIRVVLDLATTGDYAVRDVSEAFGITIDIGTKGVVTPPVPLQKPSSHAAIAVQPQPPTVSAEAKAPPLSPKPKQEILAPAETRNVGLPLKNGLEPKPSAEKSMAAEKPGKEAPPAPVVAPRGTANAPPSPVAKESARGGTPPLPQPGKDALPPAAPAPKEAANPSSATTAKEVTKASIPPVPVSLEPVPMPKTALPTSAGDRTMTRMLGLKIGRIVLDPGHGGHDTGTVGPGGLMEKDLVLQVAKELQKLLEDKLGAQVILTRTDDTFISLEERTLIANQQQADLFVSIHANSSPARNVSGVETYFLDFARTDTAREVAARENATSDRNIRDLQDLVQKIALADKQKESRELASIIQKNLFSGARKIIPASQNRGVRSAPFVVLIGAHMPSVLAEVSFLSNPTDERLLKKEVSRQSLATALFHGIEGYMKSLGSAVAQNHFHSN